MSHDSISEGETTAMTAAEPSAGLVRPDPWAALRQHTAARIALGRAGASLPTAEVLAFSLAHAQARDAVHHPCHFAGLARQLAGLGWQQVVQVHSQAPDRHNYLLRPDLGRRLLASDVQHISQAPPMQPPEVAVVVADGLSGVAIERHALPLLVAWRARFATDWACTPLVLVAQGRVAVGDEIGALLGARLVVVLIGERPGLSSPDSLGVYLTHAPRVGRMDSERNCISNIRPEGLGYADAAAKLAWLCRAALTGGQTGVALKDESPSPQILRASGADQLTT
jgi:ethanolamine ammonia-lyase small subunit